MAADLDMPIRQAGKQYHFEVSDFMVEISLNPILGAVYLKNVVTDHWEESEAEPGKEQPFHIKEQDRALIRDAIVEAVVLAPEPVQ